MYIPYVYLLKNKSTQLKYVGVRYAKGCHPKDFWNDYFTSSKSVHKLIEQFGKNDFQFKILHQYPNDPEKAILKEAEYFKIIKEKNNYINLCYSSGILDKRICSKAGKIGGSIVKNKQIGIFRCYEERKEWASLGGKIGSQKQIKNNIGIHDKNNPERFIWSSLGGKTSGNFSNSNFQSEMGKRGGIKNKGFIWYNDGTKSYKYTSKQQKKLSFDEFLKNNLEFKKGRLLNAKN